MSLKKLKWYHSLLVAMLVALIILISCVLYRPSTPQPDSVKEALIAQKIYEIQSTYVINWEMMVSYFMVCEPPEEDKELTTLIDNYLTEDVLNGLEDICNNTVIELNARDNMNYSTDRYRLVFIEPYKELDIGDFPENSILDYYPKEHIIAIANYKTDEGIIDIALFGRYRDEV